MKNILVCVVLLFAGVASAKNYIAFVNVGGAVGESEFSRAVTNDLMGVIYVDARIECAKGIDIPTLIGTASQGYPKGDRQLAVYFVDSPDFPPQVTVPGFFAIVNMRGLKKDADAKKYSSRVAKMVMKGLAFACGFGANQDIGRCVMSAGSFDTLKGIDATSASYSPFVYFPLSDYLQKRDLLAIIPEEPEEQ